MHKKSEHRLFCTLIVEDSAVFSETLSKVIHQHFPTMHLELVDDGLQVLDMVDRCKPDIILMDIKLPGIDGITLTKSIKLRVGEVVVVILSNHDIPEYRQAAFKHGADCFISKGSSSCVDEVIARLEGSLATKGITPS
ncbi:MAG: response regulator transcription factor [Chromatiales bacterium]|nr:response regulator transcription factor [Chromatiales bacterium]